MSNDNKTLNKESEIKKADHTESNKKGINSDIVFKPIKRNPSTMVLYCKTSKDTEKLNIKPKKVKKTKDEKLVDDNENK